MKLLNLLQKSRFLNILSDLWEDLWVEVVHHSYCVDFIGGTLGYEDTKVLDELDPCPLFVEFYHLCIL